MPLSALICRSLESQANIANRTVLVYNEQTYKWALLEFIYLLYSNLLLCQQMYFHYLLGLVLVKKMILSNSQCRC